jgi:hypothetical protein
MKGRQTVLNTTYRENLQSTNVFYRNFLAHFEEKKQAFKYFANLEQ